ncbi:MAG: Minf_1886 family protein, partial [bacterium]
MRDHQNLRNIVDQDPRYTIEAYIFVLEALQYTRKRIRAKGHVTGRQLLQGIKELALERYGSMAKMVFEHWGVAKTIDFGNIVINMVNKRI